MQNEVLNRRNYWCKQDKEPSQALCDALVADVKNSFRCSSGSFAGFTMSPYGFGCMNPRVRGSCWKAIAGVIREVKPFIVVLSRQNVVLQAASLIRSKEILEDVLCADPFHLELCNDDAAMHKAAPDPADLLDVALSKRSSAAALRRLAHNLTDNPSNVLSLTMEELRQANGELQIPQHILNTLGVDDPRAGKDRWMLYDDGALRGFQEAATMSMSLGGPPPKLKSYVQNYHEILSYFEENAPADLLEMARAR